MSNIGLGNNNQATILNKNLSLNEAKKLANSTLQMRIREKRNKNRTSLNIYLNKLGLTNSEKKPFLTNFNKNVNLETIKTGANRFFKSKKAQNKLVQIKKLLTHLESVGVPKEEQIIFLEKLNRGEDNLNAIKKEASLYMDEVFKRLKSQQRSELISYLNTLTLNKSNINGIIKKFDETNINLGVLKNRANRISVARQQELFVQSETEFMNFLNSLNLNAKNKTEISSKLNGYFTNWEAIKKLATNTAVERARQRRSKNRSELENFMKNKGFDNRLKREFLKNFDNGLKNVSTLKSEIMKTKKQINANKLAKTRGIFSSFLNTLFIENGDKNALLEKFDNGTTNVKSLYQAARNLETTRIKGRKSEFSLLIKELDLLNKNKVSILMQMFNEDPSRFNALINKAKNLKKIENAEKRAKIRKELREYLNTLNMLNEENKKTLLNKNITSLNNAKREGNKIQEAKKILKKQTDMVTLQNSINGFSNEDKSYLLNKFSKQNITLNTILKEASEIKIKRTKESRARERTEIYNYINKLNINVTDREFIMNKFDKTNTSVNALKNEANKLKVKRAAEKRMANRKSLEQFLKNKDLSKVDKQSLLSKFNTNNGTTLLSIQANANKLVNQRRDEKRMANRSELVKYLTSIGLSKNDANTILTKFNTTNISLFNSRTEGSKLLNTRKAEKIKANRKELENFINGLNLNSSIAQKILKNFDSGKFNVNKQMATAFKINANKKATASERQELSNYIKTLGINGSKLIKKFDNGTFTLEGLKIQAKKIKDTENAKIKRSKIDQLRKFLKNTKLRPENKESFINRIESNTNIDELKKEIRFLNRVVKNKSEEFSQKKTDLSVFLNSLDNLTNTQRKKFMKKLVNVNTNIQQIKNEAKSINNVRKQVKKEEQNIEKVKVALKTSIQDSIPGFWGRWRRGWEKSITKATTLKELNNIRTLLNNKIQLRTNILSANIDNSTKNGHMRFVMKINNSINQRKNELARNIEKKRIERVENEMAKTKPISSVAFEPNNNKYPATNNPVFNQPKLPTLKNVGKRVVKNIKVKKITNAMKKAANMEKRRAEIKNLQGVNRLTASRKLAADEERNMGRTANVVTSLFNKKAAAIKEIRGFKGAGVKNQNKFIKRIDTGENVNKVLKEARARNDLGLKQMSKTKKALMKSKK